MPKLTKQEKHKKREANRAKLHAKQQKPREGHSLPIQSNHQPGMAFRHDYNEYAGVHTVYCPIIKTRGIFFIKTRGIF